MVFGGVLIKRKVLLTWENEACLRSHSMQGEEHFEVKPTGWSKGLSVTADGTGAVPLAGAAAVRLLADRVGLTAALSQVLARRRFVPAHDRGQVLVDLATVLVAGGEAIADIDTLRHHDGLLGPVASPATVWRALDEITPAALKRIAAARAKVRRHVWTLLPDGVPAAPVAGIDLGETVVLDADATLVTAHSEKEQAAANFKGGFGFHPLGVWCDNTGELLAIRLRPGNANANHAQDHIDMLGEAIAQIPAPHRRTILVRTVDGVVERKSGRNMSDDLDPLTTPTSRHDPARGQQTLLI